MTRIRTVVAALAAALAVAAVGSAPAQAAPPDVLGPVTLPGTCPVVNEDGSYAYFVKVGTKIGPFVCGADGEWHIVMSKPASKGNALGGPTHSVIRP